MRTAGHCRLQVHERVHELDEPAIVGPADRPGLPEFLRRRLEESGERYLRLPVLAVRPGTLDDIPAPADVARTPAPTA